MKQTGYVYQAGCVGIKAFLGTIPYHTTFFSCCKWYHFKNTIKMELYKLCLPRKNVVFQNCILTSDSLSFYLANVPILVKKWPKNHFYSRILFYYFIFRNHKTCIFSFLRTENCSVVKKIS